MARPGPHGASWPRAVWGGLPLSGCWRAACGSVQQAELARGVNPHPPVQSLVCSYPPWRMLGTRLGTRKAASRRLGSPVQGKLLSQKSGYPLPAAVPACWFASRFSIAGRGNSAPIATGAGRELAGQEPRVLCHPTLEKACLPRKMGKLSCWSASLHLQNCLLCVCPKTPLGEVKRDQWKS